MAKKETSGNKNKIYFSENTISNRKGQFIRKSLLVLNFTLFDFFGFLKEPWNPGSYLKQKSQEKEKKKV